MAGRGRLLKSLLQRKLEKDNEDDHQHHHHRHQDDNGDKKSESEIRGKVTTIQENPSTSSSSSSGLKVDSVGSGRGLLMNSIWNKMLATSSPSSSLSETSSIFSKLNFAEDHPKDSSDDPRQFYNAEIDDEEKDSNPSIKPQTTQPRSLEPIVMDPISKKPLDININYVRVNRQSGYGIFQYRITIFPLNSLSNKSIIGLFENDPLKQKIGNNPAFIFGNNLFVPIKIESFEMIPISVPISIESEEVEDGDNAPSGDVSECSSINVSVSVQFVQKVPLKEQKFFFNLLFKQVMHDLNFHCMRNKFFDPDCAIELEEYMLEIWPGCVIEIGDIEKDYFVLTCDASHRVLQMTNVLKKIELLMVHQNCQQLIRRQLVGTSVLTRYNSRTYRVDEVDFDTTPNSTFRCGQKLITYVEYFRRHWSIEIKNKQQPMLIHRKTIPDLQTVSIIYLVPELCNLTGLNSIKSDKPTYSAIQRTIRLEPGLRYNKFLKFLELIHSNESAGRRLQGWGIQLDRSSFSAEAFVLNEEEIMFKDTPDKSYGNLELVSSPSCSFESETQLIQNQLKAQFFQSCGMTKSRESTHHTMHFWNRATNKSMLKPVNFERWFIVACQRDKSLIDSFVQSCRRFSYKLSIDLQPPRIVWLTSARDDCYLMAIKQNYEIDDQLIVIVTSDAVHIKSRYDAIKQLCCVQLGVPSQFIRAFTLRNSRKMDLLLPSLFVQMTCKMGGYPWAVQMPLLNAMFIGIDIYHNRKIRNQSVIGVVASLNPNATQWYSKGFIKRKNTTDLVDDEDGQLVVDSIVEALNRYRRINNRLPEYILIYRDDVGVPVSVLCSIEYSLIVRAIRSVYTGSSPLKSENTSNNPLITESIKDMMPHITFMAVAKRLSTKLYLPKKLPETKKLTSKSSTVGRDSNFNFDNDSDSSDGSNDDEEEEEEEEHKVEENIEDINLDDIDDTKFDLRDFDDECSNSSDNEEDEEEENIEEITTYKPVENVPTGTVFVYDRKKYQQFFLISQKQYRSCALPVRIRILENSDPTHLTSEHLQVISFKLCHLYYNCFYSIREPAPIRYAHKIAFFIGENLKCNPSSELDDRLYYL